ncbi:MAG TPA: hypothetical protein ENN84_09340 [Candidatus Marinimicrobia bacterium]|nr:hypothetical protein [Candidatus Neomarinimicrobiota bacterium]
MKRFFITSLFLFTFLLGTDSFPEWFLYQGRFPDITVGFSYGSSSEETDAERLYCAYQECYAYGTLYRYQDFDQKHSDYFYIFSPDSLAAIKGKLNQHGRFASNLILRQYIGAFSKKKTLELQKDLISIASLPKPDWISGRPFFQDDTYYYGVGSYPLGGNQNDAWKTAEERAVFTIMTGLAVQFHSVIISGKAEEDDDFEKVMAERLKYRLRNIQVMERYLDRSKSQVLVMVRILKGDVFSPMLKK